MRCKAHFCNGTVDFLIDERGELCPKCMSHIISDFDQKVKDKIKEKMNKFLQRDINIDNMECDDE